MSPEPSRIEELVAQFLADRQRTGAPDLEAFVQRHPEHAAELRDVLQGMAMIERAADAFDPEALLRETAADSFGVQGDAQNLGDFTQRVLAELETHGSTGAKYSAEGEIGRGGQGAVLEVWDGVLRRRLAMKVALSNTPDGRIERPSDARSLGRFLEEAQVTAQLDHPGIVPVHELGLDPARRVYFTMKLVKGRDLRSVFELVQRSEDGWSRTRALLVLLKVCEAMAYAHSKGVIHRDLKPSNVMVGKYGEAYVMDWGLARILGREDRKDIRIRPDPTDEMRSLRHTPGEDVDSPLVTMDGDVVGTPSFMPPEQARGELALVGPHSDVYAVGAMLYQLVSGEMPYVPAGSRPCNREIWALVREGPPKPLHRLGAEVPVELAAICEKAMAREVTERYRDMGELAEDLRAYMEHRVVRAHQTGAIVELRKWVERNKALAGSLAAGTLALVVGLVATVLLKEQSDANATRAAGERTNVMRLSAFQELVDLEELADELWPPWPEHTEAYEEWLRRARELVAGLDPDARGNDVGHRARLAELEARALPYTADDREADRREHPRYPELETLRARIGAMKKAQAVRAAGEQVDEVELDTHTVPSNARELDALGYLLVGPNRTTFGRESEGLALAQLALEKVEDDESLVRAVTTLALAYFANGKDQEALAEFQLALPLVPDLHRPELEFLQSKIESWSKARDTEITRQEELLTAIDAEVSSSIRRTWRFDKEEDRWWHGQVQKLIGEIEAFADPDAGLIDGISAQHGWGVARRLSSARSIDERTTRGAEARELWAEAIASISDPAVCPQYRGLVIEPQRGLLPSGRDPTSGLWEFTHVLSGERAARDENGDLVLAEETGIVLVLLPGGVFWMGAQNSSPSKRHFDPLAGFAEGPVHRVELSPFFLSKYEMTQGQWLRIAGRNPSGSIWADLLHPVEQVDWFDCMQFCERFALTLPSEAQWEYGARGGTATVWWTGDDRTSLAGAANLADAYAHRTVNTNWDWAEEWLDDGYADHAPVDQYAPNAFGLHNVHGNVWEWCLDMWDPRFYEKSPLVDPVCVTPGSASALRVMRGGGHDDTATAARCAARSFAGPASMFVLGLRPACAVRGKVRLALDERRNR